MSIVLAGYTLDFWDCREIVGSGPEACSLSIEGDWIEGKRFDPSPLEWQSSILIPVRKIGFFSSGFALGRIAPSTRQVSLISKTFPYMKLLRLEGDAVVFAKATCGIEEGKIKLC